MAQKLFVGNLAYTVTDSTLSDFAVNAGYQVASATVVRDRMSGESRGFGFIEFADGVDMQKAIEGLNGQSLEGRRLTVNEARPQRTGFSRPPGGGGHRGGGGGRFGRRRDE